MAAGTTMPRPTGSGVCPQIAGKLEGPDHPQQDKEENRKPRVKEAEKVPERGSSAAPPPANEAETRSGHWDPPTVLVAVSLRSEADGPLVVGPTRLPSTKFPLGVLLLVWWGRARTPGINSSLPGVGAQHES